MRFHVPLRLPSLANLHSLTWQRLSGIKRKHKTATRRAMSGFVPPKPPWVVIITRVGKRKLDGDNLYYACKFVRDEIARIIGVDDGSGLYTWDYRQRIGEYGVEIEVLTRGDGL